MCVCVCVCVHNFQELYPQDCGAAGCVCVCVCVSRTVPARLWVPDVCVRARSRVRACVRACVRVRARVVCVCVRARVHVCVYNFQELYPQDCRCQHCKPRNHRWTGYSCTCRRGMLYTHRSEDHGATTRRNSVLSLLASVRGCTQVPPRIGLGRELPGSRSSMSARGVG